MDGVETSGMSTSLWLRLVGGFHAGRGNPGQENLTGALTHRHRSYLAEIGPEDVDHPVGRAPRLQRVDPAPRINGHTAIAGDGYAIAFPAHDPALPGVKLHESLRPRTDQQTISAITGEVSGAEAKSSEARPLGPLNRVDDGKPSLIDSRITILDYIPQSVARHGAEASIAGPEQRDRVDDSASQVRRRIDHADPTLPCRL